jgi:hypothetical protein
VAAKVYPRLGEINMADIVIQCSNGDVVITIPGLYYKDVYASADKTVLRYHGNTVAITTGSIVESVLSYKVVDNSNSDGR